MTECSDGNDNDGDTAIDALDPNCDDGFDDSEAPTCTDGADNDGDGWADGDDPDCLDPSGDEVGGFDPAIACNDGADNDGDGDADADDTECDDGYDGSETDATPDDCFDGADNDADGYTDALDPDCGASPFDELGFGTTECNDNVDNDVDGFLDALDPDCIDASDDDESGPCDDGLDNDGDGWTDLDDPACTTAFDPSEGSFDGGECNDNVDNDGDGSTDAADPGCADGLDTVEGAGFGDVVVTEFMANPDAVSDGNGEWIELFNNTTAPIDIEGWTIADNNGSHVITTGGSLPIPSLGFVVLGRNTLTSANGGVVLDYSYAGSLSLASAGDNIDLSDEAANPITSLVYGSGVVQAGVSAILDGGVLAGPFTAAQAVDIGSNWCSSTTAWTGSAGDAGSPGEMNETCP